MINRQPDETVGFSCDRCGAVAMAEGRPIVFGSLAEMQIVAVRDGWLDEGDSPVRDFLVCPPCRQELAAEYLEGGPARER